MSLLHIVMITSPSDDDVFLSVYAPVSLIVPFMFIFVVNLGVILSISLTLLYKSQVDERNKVKDVALPIY